MYYFCPKCGSNLKECYIESEKRNRQICQNCGFIFYKCSKPCVGVFLIRNNSVLLIKRAIEPFKGFWDIPGGFLEAGEHPATGAIRELQEETGLIIEPIEILDIFMDEYGSEQEDTLNICYIANVVGGVPKAGSDATDMKWFSLDSLPDKIAFKWQNKALELLKNRLS